MSTSNNGATEIVLPETVVIDGNMITTSSLSADDQLVLNDMLNSTRMAPINNNDPLTVNSPGSPAEQYYEPEKEPRLDDPKLLRSMSVEGAAYLVDSLKNGEEILMS